MLINKESHQREALYRVTHSASLNHSYKNILKKKKKKKKWNLVNALQNLLQMLLALFIQSILHTTCNHLHLYDAWLRKFINSKLHNIIMKELASYFLCLKKYLRQLSSGSFKMVNNLTTKWWETLLFKDIFSNHSWLGIQCWQLAFEWCVSIITCCFQSCRLCLLNHAHFVTLGNQSTSMNEEAMYRNACTHEIVVQMTEDVEFFSSNLYGENSMMILELKA